MHDLEVELEPRQERLRAELRSWLARNAPPRPPADDEQAALAHQRDWHARLSAAGWSAIGWPVEFGGRAATALDSYVYHEELSRAGVPRLLSTPGIALVGPVLMRHGTPAQQARHLPRILSGEDVWCLGLSEPEAGSDLAGLRAEARLEDGTWVLDGRKTWVRWGARSTHCAVLVRTEPTPRHRGLSFLVVALDDPGVSVRPLRSIDGRHTFDTVEFDRVRVPADAVVGERGGGWAVAMGLMELERADQSFADHTELLELLRAALAAAEARRRDGGLDDAALDRLRRGAVAVWTQCQLFRAVNLRTARRLQRGEPVGTEGSLIKLHWTRAYQQLAAVVEDACGAGLLADDDWSRRYLDARATSIFSGTSEIQRTVVGERIARLPRTPTPSKG